MDDDQAPRLLKRLAADVPVDPTPIGDLLHRRRAARRRRRFLVAGTAAACLLVTTGVVVTMTGGVGDGAASPSQQVLADSNGDRRGELPASGSASCVQIWTDDQPIAEQSEFAFDGVITDIGGPGLSNRPGAFALDLVSVTFRVQEWFAGGTEPEVSVDMYPPLEQDQGQSENTIPAYAPGSRLLVSGAPRWGGAPLDDPIVWMCGFTQYYDQETADAWRTGG